MDPAIWRRSDRRRGARVAAKVFGALVLVALALVALL